MSSVDSTIAAQAKKPWLFIISLIAGVGGFICILIFRCEPYASARTFGFDQTSQNVLKIILLCSLVLSVGLIVLAMRMFKSHASALRFLSILLLIASWCIAAAWPQRPLIDRMSDRLTHDFTQADLLIIAADARQMRGNPPERDLTEETEQARELLKKHPTISVLGGSPLFDVLPDCVDMHWVGRSGVNYSIRIVDSQEIHEQLTHPYQKGSNRFRKIYPRIWAYTRPYLSCG